MSNSSDNLTTIELMDMLKNSLREVNSMETSNRNFPNALNRLKNTALGAKVAVDIANYQLKKNSLGIKTDVLVTEFKDMPKKLLK